MAFFCGLPFPLGSRCWNCSLPLGAADLRARGAESRGPNADWFGERLAVSSTTASQTMNEF